MMGLNNYNDVKEQYKAMFDKPVRVDISDVYTTQGHSFERNKNIWDSSDFWMDEVCFPKEYEEQLLKEIAGEYENPLCCEGEIEDRVYQNKRESLAYWTVYFQPGIEDVQVAIECGLVPFYFEDEFYLALGGCGMDLSPKLDAYQALTCNNISSSSQLFSADDGNYFEYVVGKEITEKVRVAIKREKPLVTISFDLD